MLKETSQAPDRIRVPALVVFAAFLKLGLSSFGGPLAHIAYFRREFVDRRGWLRDSQFTDIVALCHFLPGPTSSQTGFAIGLTTAGPLGALAAFIGFTFPSAVLMLGAAYASTFLSGPALPALVHGLNLVAVAIVAQAILLMARTNLRSLPLAAIALLALTGVLTGGAYAAPAMIAIAALTGLILPPTGPPPRSHTPARTRTAHNAARNAAHTTLAPSVALFALFLGLLILLPTLRQLAPGPAIATADGFYRTGALVFGGGHAVLPLIETETPGIAHADFLAGYGAAQALPGPLFSFAAFAGALNAPTPPSIALGLVALGAIFLPGFLLVGAALPIWSRLRSNRRAARLVSFAGAAVVGVLAAAWWTPVVASAVLSPWDAIIALAGFGLLLIPRMPVLAVVAGVAASGAIAQVLH